MIDLQQLHDGLPGHACHHTNSFSQSSKWTTPKGMWSLRFGHLKPVFIDGPNTLVRLGVADTDLILATLRLHGAIDTPDPAVAQLGETTDTGQDETGDGPPAVIASSNPADWWEPEPAPSGPVPLAQGIVVTLSEPFPPAMGHAHREAARAEALRQRRIQGGGIR